MFCNGPIRPPLQFFGEDAHPHFFEMEEQLLDLYYHPKDDDYDHKTKKSGPGPVPGLYLFIGCNYLTIDRKSCPDHLNDIQKLCLIKLLNAKKRNIEAPMVILNAVQETPQVNLDELLNRPNHLVINDLTIDKILNQLVADVGIAGDIQKIGDQLN